MKLYDGIGPNPRMVRMFLHEKGLELPKQDGFRYAEGIELFRSRMRVLPEAAEGLKTIAREKLAWLDALMPGRRSAATGMRG